MICRTTYRIIHLRIADATEILDIRSHELRSPEKSESLVNEMCSEIEKGSSSRKRLVLPGAFETWPVTVDMRFELQNSPDVVWVSCREGKKSLESQKVGVPSPILERVEDAPFRLRQLPKLLCARNTLGDRLVNEDWGRI